ncbi:uncharacterized protein LOC142976027 [Anticarsia gemmatalis]|uniref:uncharacterized protein LOC142976027 n=1 Tax=Anticarsia gemmatalis TaxID=129554 RepID=UPI003F765C36
MILSQVVLDIMFKCVIICVSCLVATSIASNVDFIKPCKTSDSSCIVNSAKIAIDHLVDGDKSLGIPALDPLVVNNIDANSGDLKLSFRDFVVHGIKNVKINKIERDPVKNTAYLDLELPLKCVGKYTFGGKIFVVDIEGDGPVEIEGVMRITATIRLKKITKNGQEYYKVSGFDFDYEPLTVFNLVFHNLYNGDKERAEPVEQIIKQSWKEMLLDVGKPVITKIVLKCIKITDKVFLAMPANEIEIA